jgi:hypothetical protein
MNFVLAINFLANMFTLFGNYYFNSVTTDMLAVRNPSIMKTLPVCMKFKYEDVEVMKEEY